MAKLAFRHLALLFLIGITGCTITHQVNPKPQPIDPNLLPELNISNAVAIVGELQTTPIEVKFCKGGPHEYFADLNVLTSAAIRVLEDAFSQNNIEVNKSAKKNLKISVVDAGCEGTFSFLHTAKIKVLAGNSITKEFSGHQSHGHIFGTTWSVEMAITNAVLEMLKDEDIINYLKS